MEKRQDVTVSTIQRIYSILRGEAELDPELDEHSAYELASEPLPVEYNPGLPPEECDIVIVDECHCSIYGLWRQVLDYFDAFTIGLTATPNKQAFGFFNQNLVMEYGHEQAGRGRRQRRLRRLPDPHRDRRAGKHDRGRDRDAVPRPAVAPNSRGEAGRGPRLHGAEAALLPRRA